MVKVAGAGLHYSASFASTTHVGCVVETSLQLRSPFIPTLKGRNQKMGLTKNYLRFVHDSTFGLVAASQVGGSIKFLQIQNTRGRFLAVPANENVFIWNLKTKQIVNRLSYDADNSAEVTVIACYHGGHPRTNLIAVGYANGYVRVFEYETGLLKVTFTGHRTAVSAVAFDKNGSRLASGGKDCKIVIWDIVGEKGLFSLAGHKNSISKLAFLYNDEYQRDIIVSSSIDAVSTIKFWDLQIQHCFCTVPGQASGVWSFVILKNGTRLVTGSTSSELRVYSIEFSEALDKNKINSDNLDDEPGLSEAEYGLQLRHMGTISRNSSTISSRVQDIVCDQDETFMICHSIDKNIELYGLRSKEDIISYRKKQEKKFTRRLAKRKKAGDDCDGEETAEPTFDASAPQNIVDCEFNRKIGSRRLPDKIKAVAIIKCSSKKGQIEYKIAAMYSSNKIESFLLYPSNDDKDDSLKQIECIEDQGHRTDVRAIAISPDNSLIMSASADTVKIWRLESRSCITTIECEYANCCVFADAQNITGNFKNRFGLLGTKQGHIQIFNIAEARIVQTIEVCEGDKPLSSICVLPDKTGIVCGGDDGVVRFYNFVWQHEEDEGQRSTNLGLEENRKLSFQEGITCVNVSSNGNLLAVALLDSTVRVHFMDTFKYFLTMYGHKFPVTTMDISDDNTLLATGSPDKNIKIWGLDFGDCRKSIFAHDDAITCVKFVPKTHYIFSCGRDKLIKQWDCDHFIKIQTLRRHQAEIWCLSISPNGKCVVTGSHDKSIRSYRRTEEILIPTEEDETEREIEDERNVFEKQENIVVGEVSLETGFATKMTVDTVKSTDRLIEAIDVFGSEREKERIYKNQCELAASKGEPKPVEPEHDPLLMTAMARDYHRFMLEILRRIKSSELEEVLLTLPFDYVSKLISILVIFIERGWDIELMIRCATFLLKVNFGQIAASPPLMPVVHKLKNSMLERSHNLRDCTGFNLLALEHIC